MFVTAAEFKSNIGKYLEMAATENVFIIESGTVIAKLTKPDQDRQALAKSLFGILPSDISFELVREERLADQ